ncbi:MAG TPA: CRISPR-associated endonuclease Cas1, partial [Candidatus Bathyarchaeia archaeon]|nr:CRISPR-associated endonuclease Cas1 [Candidatus Bathyarchaeia archaeon]
RLIAKDGFLEPDTTQHEYVFQPRRMSHDSIVIDGQTGSVSIAAIKWLMRHGVPLFILDYNGTLLSSTLPREPVNGPLTIAQVEAYKDSARRFYIAKKIIEAKTKRSCEVLKWLAERYGNPSYETDFNSELSRLTACNDLRRLLMVEGRIADIYWRYLEAILPGRLGFVSRMHESHQMNASDPVNVLLNYGYAILESECRKALNTVGLAPTVGFLHEARQTRYALVYDMMEPYRWLVDLAVIECLEYERFSKKDFYRLDNYVLRLRPEAVKKLLAALQLRFNSTARYRNKFYGWSTVIRLHCEELASYVLAKRSELDFSTPNPMLNRDESEALRNRILSMTVAGARQLGVRKNTLWYMQRRARSSKPLEVYSRMKTKLSREDQAETQSRFVGASGI